MARSKSLDSLVDGLLKLMSYSGPDYCRELFDSQGEAVQAEILKVAKCDSIDVLLSKLEKI